MQLWERRGDGLLRTVCDYVHLNPVLAKLLRPGWFIGWTSLVWYAAAPEHRTQWIRLDQLRGEHGIQRDNAPGRQKFERRLEARRLEQTDEEALRVCRRGR